MEGEISETQIAELDAHNSQIELRLVNVARSSLEELLLDYEDFLRHRRMKKRAPDGPEALALRTAQSGKNAGKQFWGCSAYPDCKGVVNV